VTATTAASALSSSNASNSPRSPPSPTRTRAPRATQTSATCSTRGSPGTAGGTSTNLIAVLTVRPDRNATALYLRRRPGRPLAREGDNATSDYTTDPTLAAPNTGQVVTVDELDRSWRDRAAARHDEATSDKRALSEQLAELERRHHAAGLDLPFEVRTAIRRKISVARRRIDDMGAGTP
jgi:hypothetical protein